MSTYAKITLIGLYHYDATLFDNLALPTGYDSQTFIDTLLLEHGEKPVLYPDFDFMKFSIGAVSRKWAEELKRIYDVLTAEYNPIENYDRHEDITDDYIHGTTATTERLTDETTEDKVSAFNESTYQPDRKTIISGGKVSNTMAGKDTTDHDGHVHGNIGVTTSQQMIESEIDLRTKNNIYEIAARVFANELLIQIY